MGEIARTFVTLACLALLVEAAVGYPDWVFRAIGHPVTWIGALIGAADRTFNRASLGKGTRQVAGVLAILVIAAVAVMAGATAEAALLRLPFGIVFAAVLGVTLTAQRSLYDHVAQVALALETEGLAAARETVALIVGRDPDCLDEAGVARAAIESLAENFSDAVVAPALWLAAAGLAGGATYKVINTADSMIGHRTERHRAFGWAAARLDDLVNLPASRLAAVLIVAAAGADRSGAASAGEAWRGILRDASRHRSPNAGYPEAAFAGALGLALAGPRVYGGVKVEDALMGRGRRDATAADIRAALVLYRRADAILLGLMTATAAAFWL